MRVFGSARGGSLCSIVEVGFAHESSIPESPESLCSQTAMYIPPCYFILRGMRRKQFQGFNQVKKGLTVFTFNLMTSITVNVGSFIPVLRKSWIHSAVQTKNQREHGLNGLHIVMCIFFNYGGIKSFYCFPVYGLVCLSSAENA